MTTTDDLFTDLPEQRPGSHYHGADWWLVHGKVISWYLKCVKRTTRLGC